MNAKEIDELFNAFATYDYKYIWECAGMEEPYSPSKLQDSEIESQMMMRIYERIKNGDFEYFKNKAQEDIDSLQTVETLMIYAHDSEEIKNLIEKREELGIERVELVMLILATNDYEFIDKCIENKEEYGLDTYDTIDLIKKTNNPQFISKYVEQYKEMGFYKGDVLSLMCAISDPELIYQYVQRRNEFELKKSDVLKLIMLTTDTAYVDKYISQRDELELTRLDILKLIIGTKNPSYIGKYIERREEFGLNKNDIVVLIREINDPALVDQYINRREEFSLNSSDVLYIIMTQEGLIPAYIDRYIDRSAELGFKKDDILALIECINPPDPKYFKKYFDRAEEYGLSHDDIIHLIIKTNNQEFINQCLSRKDEMGLSKTECLKLSIAVGHEECVDEIAFTDETEILLPEDMKIGIEIESVGREAEWIKKRGNLVGWKSEYDGTVSSGDPNEKGVEIVSPILTGDTGESTKQIKRTCSALEVFGQYSNRTCGGHIHIGHEYLKTTQAWRNLEKIWNNSERVLYIISNAEGEVPRTGIWQFASPISKQWEEGIKSGSIDITDESDIEELMEKIAKAQGSRYRAISFYNLKKGIEFRLSNGTISAKTWIENINLFGGIVKAAQDLSIIQMKSESQRTNHEKHLLECFERLSNEELEEREILEQLIEIAVPDKVRDVYRRRYEINSALIRQDKFLDVGLSEKTSSKKPVITRDEIGRIIYTGPDRVTGHEFDIVESLLLEEILNDEHSEEQQAQSDAQNDQETK